MITRTKYAIETRAQGLLGLNVDGWVSAERCDDGSVAVQLNGPIEDRTLWPDELSAIGFAATIMSHVNIIGIHEVEVPWISGDVNG